MDEGNKANQLAAHALRIFDDNLEEAERAIISHHNVHVARWTLEQQLAIRRAAEFDDEAMKVKAVSSAACISAIRADEDAFAFERSETCRLSTVARKSRDRDFYDDLCALGQARFAETMKLLRRTSDSMQANSEEFQESTLDQLDKRLVAAIFRKAREAFSGKSLPSTLAEEFANGNLQQVLDIERDGWFRSQSSDIEQLFIDADSEMKDALEQLLKQIEVTAPASVITASQHQQLQEIAEMGRRHLETVERESCAAFASEIDASMHRIEDDYRGYDCDLEDIVFRTLEQRYASAAEMRQLKLALCRWRLEYQRVYHDQCAKEVTTTDQEGRRGDRVSPKDSDAVGRRQLEKYRRAVGRIWSEGKVPVGEMQSFLGNVINSLANESLASPIVDLYEEELNRYGALPLLEHVDRPEVLEVWFSSLTRKRHTSIISGS
eukprot:TRINITY_DN3714_c0_g4_i1.p1 TRINITY_DN3714_c0_g4~~TRINITY_DN3714_c0_g4_i1.p1  ORF type:complete len:447 (+),score=93.45 TRINITY_DN3714_c0_g4_i1:34-1341(+)